MKKCSYCKKPFENLVIDHIVPLKSGGTDRESNLTLACEECNSLKSDKSLSEFLSERKIVGFKKSNPNEIPDSWFKKNWEETQFIHKVRITKEDLDYLKVIKGRQSMARKLQEIINKHRLSNGGANAKQKYGTT